jgi:hypothetical protein
MSDDLTQSIDPLFQEIRQLIDTAKQRRNHPAVLENWQPHPSRGIARAAGRIWQTGNPQPLPTTHPNLRQRLDRETTAATFPDEQIVSAVRRQLTWTHIKTLMCRAARGFHTL